MAEKNKRKIYYPTAKESEAHRTCTLRNIAFSMRKTTFAEDLYYIEKYDPRQSDKTDYLRKDLSLPHGFNNRLKLTEYEAWKKVFELYLKQAEIINKTERESKNHQEDVVDGSSLGDGTSKMQPMRHKKDDSSLSVQIDLLDMIQEVEKENKSHDK